MAVNHPSIVSDAQPTTLPRESPYAIRLIQLHGARWRLMARMEEYEQSDAGLFKLDGALASHRAEPKTCLAHHGRHA